MATSPSSWVLPSLGLWLISTSILLRLTDGAASWCVASSNTSDEVLQSALDYACGAGADCTPIQLDGLCYLPNTLESHASYAFNSYYQKKGMAPGSCDFSGLATVALTDPSYGSCAFPSSVSTAGGTVPSSTPVVNNPNRTPPTFGGGGSVGGVTPLGSTSPNLDDNSMASLPSCSLILISLVCVLPFLFPTI
ncbi:Plasmodesmata callose-binding protein 3 [Cinnamomum micranthum f. kanehirae]|uniref:Plasmodesmata callose-binding protein 3 n=1 Tax=Cinnamomum micranthum f. kanehirae TaxID=337451 RepID=A0A443P8Q3_9MAGN|nr:Plasmodesmata callose-binding protein 3 [Cinnamomum micranthum f. kanehirae]